MKFIKVATVLTAVLLSSNVFAASKICPAIMGKAITSNSLTSENSLVAKARLSGSQDSRFNETQSSSDNIPSYGGGDSDTRGNSAP